MLKEFAMEIEEKIRFVRKTLGFSQEEFAEYFNVSQRTLSAIEISDRKVTYTFLKDLVQKFNINPVWLFNDDAEPFLGKENDA